MKISAAYLPSAAAAAEPPVLTATALAEPGVTLAEAAALPSAAARAVPVLAEAVARPPRVALLMAVPQCVALAAEKLAASWRASSVLQLVVFELAVAVALAAAEAVAVAVALVAVASSGTAARGGGREKGGGIRCQTKVLMKRAARDALA